MHKYAQELGLTPAARSRLIAGKDSTDRDEMEELLED
jgi:phage terminase small subunit